MPMLTYLIYKFITVLLSTFQVHLFFPIFFLCVTLFLVIFPLFTNASECLVALVMILTGIPVYLIFIAWRSKPRCITKWIGK